VTGENAINCGFLQPRVRYRLARGVGRQPQLIAVAEPQTPARARSSALTTAALPAVLTLSWTGALTILLAAPSNAV
jgi:hypothetical protein